MPVQALRCLADMVSDHTAAKDALLRAMVPVEHGSERPALEAALQVALQGRSAPLRDAAEAALQAFCEGNADGQTMLASTMAPVGDHDSPGVAGGSHHLGKQLPPIAYFCHTLICRDLITLTPLSVLSVEQRGLAFHELTCGCMVGPRLHVSVHHAGVHIVSDVQGTARLVGSWCGVWRPAASAAAPQSVRVRHACSRTCCRTTRSASSACWRYRLRRHRQQPAGRRCSCRAAWPTFHRRSSQTVRR